MIHTCIHSSILQAQVRDAAAEEKDVFDEPAHGALRPAGAGERRQELWCSDSRRNLQQGQLRDVPESGQHHPARGGASENAGADSGVGLCVPDGLQVSVHSGEFVCAEDNLISTRLCECGEQRLDYDGQFEGRARMCFLLCLESCRVYYVRV